MEGGGSNAGLRPRAHLDIPHGDYTLDASGQPSLQVIPERDRASGELSVSWVCPECGGPVQTHEVRPLVIVGLVAGPPPSATTVECDCGRVHAGSADGVTGCGFSFSQDLGAEAVRLSPPRPLPNDQRPWLAQMQAKELSALSDLRSSAATWAGSLATALGAVSLSAILTGSKTFGGLATTPAHWGEVLFILAGALALVATGLALYTAQQSSLKLHGTDVKAYQDWSRRQVTNGMDRLHASQGLAAAATAAALAAAGILFFGASAPSKPTTIVLKGTTLCKAGAPSSTTTSEAAGYVVECGK